MSPQQTTITKPWLVFFTSMTLGVIVCLAAFMFSAFISPQNLDLAVTISRIAFWTCTGLTAALLGGLYVHKRVQR